LLQRDCDIAGGYEVLCT